MRNSKTDSLTPYSATKESGLPWLGQVPRQWEILRGKHIFDPIDIRSQHGIEELLTVSASRGVIPRSTANVTMFEAENYSGHKLCWPGDLVINSLWAWAQGLGISQHHGIVSTAYGVYRLKPEFNEYTQLIHYLTRSTPFQWELQVRSKGIWTSRLQLTDEAFLDAPFPIPPIDEQSAIVRYLDAADQQIQAYIGAKQKLIALLEEERQAAIHQAVTRGLDPNARLKPSSVEWLGYVPEHWQTRRLRTVADMRVSNVDKHTNEDESPVRLCNYVDVYKNERITEDIPFMHASASPDEIERFRLICNDVIITKDSETWDDIGVPALVEYSATDLVCGYHLAILRPTEIVHGPFLARALQSETVCRQFHVGAKGVTRYGLAQNAIQDALIPLPPLREQKVIAKQLDQDTKAIDATKKAAHQQIELMQEYRTRLIADAVTGKIDVRKVAEELPQLGPAEIID